MSTVEPQLRSEPALPVSAPTAASRFVTARAVGVGLAAVAVISAVVSYNDYTLSNTPLIGNYLPIGAMLFVFGFVVLVNGPLSRLRPGWAFSTGELCAMFAVVLVGCAIPSTGLIRYLMPSFVAPHLLAGQDAAFGQLMSALKLPEWIFPSLASSDPVAASRDPVVTGYLHRWTEDGGYPYGAFVRPLLTWGLFFGLLGAALVSMVLVVHPQWSRNERLPFPLAQIQMALLEAPARGRWFNETLRSRPFWLALGGVVLLHGWNGLSVYSEGKVPAIPLGFNLASLFTAPPFSYADNTLYKAQLFITAAAVTYFLRPQVGLSLWLFFAVQQLAKMQLGTATGDPSIRGQADLQVGGFLAFVAMVLFTGRRHYLAVLRAAFVPGREGTAPEGTVAARVLVVTSVLLAGWLVAAGCTVLGAVVIVLTLLTLFLGLTRIVAESGVLHAQLAAPVTRPFTLAAQLGIGSPTPVPMETYFHAQKLQCILYDQRESLPVYASHAWKNCETGGVTHVRRQRGLLLLAMVLAVLVAYPVASYFHLRNEYTHAATLDRSQQTPIDMWGAQFNWQWQFAPGMTNYSRGPTGNAPEPLPWAASGFALVAGLYTARLHFPAFPLHPIGVLMVGTYAMTTLWFSFFVGHCAKTLAVRLGGYELYSASKPLAVGLIVGECLATGLWLLVAMVLASLGLPYKPIVILPM